MTDRMSEPIKVKGLWFCYASRNAAMRENHQRAIPARHPQEIMRELGITYALSVPQSLHDGWQFYLPENVPDDLPSYLTWFEHNPLDRVGFGLDEHMAKDLIAKAKARDDDR